MNAFEIKISPTSNAAIKKFETSQFLVDHTSYEFNNIDEAQNSPLAQQLFYLPFVKTVYIAQNFIAVEKYSIVQWEEVENELAEQIENFLNANDGKVVTEEAVTKKVPVTVYAESTPNPSVIKFVSNKKLVSQSFEFKDIAAAQEAPLAAALFHFPFVKEVFLDENYVSVQKHDIVSWDDVFQEVREFIREHIANGKPIVNDNIRLTPTQAEDKKEEVFDNLDDTSKEIVNIIEEYVKPAVASDGGNILFKRYDAATGNVSVILQGACSGCPSSTFTLKNGIETMLKEMLPGKVNSVEAING
ncbi:MAG: NifU family protein [Leeuwenhoekiella sp.]